MADAAWADGTMKPLERKLLLATGRGVHLTAVEVTKIIRRDVHYQALARLRRARSQKGFIAGFASYEATSRATGAVSSSSRSTGSVTAWSTARRRHLGRLCHATRTGTTAP